MLIPGCTTASRTTRRFGFCQPVSDPLGPVQIAVSANRDGLFYVLGAGPNGLRIMLVGAEARRTPKVFDSRFVAESVVASAMSPFDPRASHPWD